MEYLRQGKNNYPFWFYREVSLNTTSPESTVTIQALPGRDFLLNYIYCQYITVGGASPSTFADIRFRLTFPQLNRQYINVPVPAQEFTSPGRFNPFTGGNEQPNQVFFRSKKLGYAIKEKMTFELHISNYIGAANPNLIDVLFIGRNVFKKGRKV